MDLLLACSLANAACHLGWEHEFLTRLLVELEFFRAFLNRRLRLHVLTYSELACGFSSLGSVSFVR